MAGTKRRWGFTLGSLLMAGCLAVACQDSREGGPDEAQAGAGGGGPAGGGPGAVEGPCNLGDIDDVCSERQCPDSSADVTPVCSAFGTIRYATECGTMIHVTQGLGATSYYFDEDDQLIGITTTDDKIRDCGDGHESISTVAGTTCKAVGEGEDLCDTDASCRTDDVCDRSVSRFIDCPENLGSFEPTCHDGYHTERRGSSCDGTLIEISDGIQTQRFTFDEDGELVGTTWSGDVGDVACWGEPCSPRGTIEDLCESVGGAGGGGGEGGMAGGGAEAGGAGGAGGAP